MAAELIPGLPDDIALECLLRLPFHAFADALRVCKRWRQTVTSPSFCRLRKASGHARPLVALIQFNRSAGPGCKNLTLFEPTTGVWTRLPGVVPAIFKWSGYSEVVSMGHELLVMICRDRPCPNVGTVLVYNLLTGVWRLDVTTLSPRRPIFPVATSAEARMAYVAGGQNVHRKQLRSALVYDLERGPRKRLPIMPSSRRERRGIFFNDGFIGAGGIQWTSEDSELTLGRPMVSILEEGKWRKVAVPAELTFHAECYSSFQL